MKPVFPTRAEGVARSGLLYLRDSVAEYFTAFGVPAVVAPVGLHYRSFQLNVNAPGGGNRVVFIPGVFDGDAKPKPRKYGALSRTTRNAGAVVNPRELASWERPFTLSVWAAPQPGSASSEYDEGLEDLLEQTVRGLQSAGAASIRFGEVLINSPPVEGAFGAELLVQAMQVGPLFDVSYDYVQAKPSIVK
jgi:hypothetical protein